MSKLSQLDKAIAALEAEKAVIDHAIAKLREQQATKPARRPKKAEPRVVGGINTARTVSIS